MQKEDPKQLKRVTVYLSESEYRQLKSRLALTGLSVSEWVRRKISKYLDEN